MQIVVNGETVSITSTKLKDVVQELGFCCERIVIAINCTFVPKDQWDEYHVQGGDELDVLSPIEGG